MKVLRVLAVVATAALIGCADEPPPDPTAGVGAGVGAGAGTGYTAGMPAPNTVAYFNQVVGDRVFFATDEYTLDGQAQEILRAQAEWLNTNPGTSITVEGHADERGTRQYNLALGARRANSVREFLTAHGVSPGRVNAVTFGKERPVALCSDDSCWSQNRRGVSVVTGAPTS